MKELSKACRQNGITISSAESFTGGLFSEWVTDLSGASQLFAGGVVCYSDSVKQHVLGVKAETLAESGAVSKECAKELAAGVKADRKRYRHQLYRGGGSRPAGRACAGPRLYRHFGGRKRRGARI